MCVPTPASPWLYLPNEAIHDAHVVDPNDACQALVRGAMKLADATARN